MKRHAIAALAAIMLALAGADAARAQGTTIQGDSQQTGTLNGSVAITTGNTFQTVLPALTSTNYPGTPSRRSLTINNNNTSDSCWIFIGSGTATKAISRLLTSGQTITWSWPYVPADAIQATCTTTADTLYVDTQ